MIPRIGGIQEQLMKTCGESGIMGRCGNAKRRGHWPDRSEVKKVFDIQPRVAIDPMVKLPYERPRI